MASNDDFEESSGGTVDECIEEYKYAQLHVPNHEFDVSSTTAASQADNLSGSSFIRLGSFPAFTLTDDDTAVTGRSVSTVADDAPSGFRNSLNLAKLVGDATAIASATTTDDGSPGGKTYEDASAFEGDPQYLLGFADDTRYRASGETTWIREGEAENTTAARKAESQTLLTKGGWWDHSDGNRITTTSGDKVEVIQGNYKMVILGRQSADGFDIGKTAITDFSGGHFQEQYTSPTPAIKTVGWVQDENGWALFQDNGSGNVTTKFHGRQIDYFTGPRKESVTGSDPGAVKGTVSTPDDTQDPALVSRTWAQKIEAYTGSANKPVPHIYSLTYADAINDVKFAASVVSSTTAASIVSTSSAASILSINVGGLITTLNTAVLSTQIDLVPQTIGIKLGSDLSVGVSKAGVWMQDEDMSVNKNTLAAAMSEVLATAGEIVATKLSAGLKRTTLSGQAMLIGNSIMNAALNHQFV